MGEIGQQRCLFLSFVGWGVSGEQANVTAEVRDRKMGQSGRRKIIVPNYAAISFQSNGVFERSYCLEFEFPIPILTLHTTATNDRRHARTRPQF